MSARAEFLDVGPYRRASGAVKLPGSKSISNRTLLLAALCKGRTMVKGLLKSDDTDVMLEALLQLGAGVQVLSASEGDVVVDGCKAFSIEKAELLLGNAGTAFRPLTAALSIFAAPGSCYKLSGVPRMHERPIGDLVDALRMLGADIHYLQHAGFPPLEIRARQPMSVDRIQVRGDVSSQFLSALLLSLPILTHKTGSAIRIEVMGELISKPYVDITLNLMAQFGVTVGREDWRAFVVPANATYQLPTGGAISVEGDASSASYFLAAGAIGGGPVKVVCVGTHSIQGDTRFADVLGLMGAQVQMGSDWMEVSAPASGKLVAIDADLNHIPDAAMTIAICALFADGTTTIRNIASWRVKETDRIAAMATELRKLGAVVEEGADYIRVTPPFDFKTDVTIDTYDDHRMAMCFSLVSLAGIRVRINDPDCVAKTFPSYFAELKKIAS
ncbi:MAG: 3-phosphoshikimate 1-carboxyvinyltransferase [Burkholderiales bacterium]|nr:3-phosphoshikimate 1-carboxyvinyltransferase [Burkholderiales bacterium]